MSVIESRASELSRNIDFEDGDQYQRDMLIGLDEQYSNLYDQGF